MDSSLILKNVNKKYEKSNFAIKDISFSVPEGSIVGFIGENGAGDSDIMMTDTINPLKSKFKGFHKTFKQDDLGLSLSSFLLN